MLIQKFTKQFSSLRSWGQLYSIFFTNFADNRRNCPRNFMKLFERRDVSLATKHSILVLIRITILIREFYNRFFQLQDRAVLRNLRPTSKIMKKALGETQTLRAGRSNAEPKNFAPIQTPFTGAQDRQNLITWRWSLPLPTNPVW